MHRRAALRGPFVVLVLASESGARLLIVHDKTMDYTGGLEAD